MEKLLTRDAFRAAVFQRDGNKCIFCKAPAVDAHHIMERRLFTDGGYYLSNGASVCEFHHIECETTRISVEDVRKAANIQKKILPDHLYDDIIYDKWGNVILEDGRRLKGELYFDISVQKALSGPMYWPNQKDTPEFIEYVKYPRTYHLPWSPGMHDDDRMMGPATAFHGRRVVVTEKMDGENTTMYRDHIHARSVTSEDHVSRHWVKNFWQKIRWDIPPNHHICGENLYAKHSISYTKLKSFFLGFSVWDGTSCLSWDTTIEYLALLGVDHVPILYDGIYDEERIREIALNYAESEGYVLRIADSFDMRDFRKYVGKYVRKDHVQTSQHWKNRKLEPNRME